MAALQLCVVGSLNVDLVSFMDVFPKPGETVMGTQFVKLPGGKGANQAVAAALLCSPEQSVRMIGAIGDDALGKDYISPTGVFVGSGVDCSGVTQIPGVSTGVAPIFVDAKGENSIVVVPGANALLSGSHVDACLATLPPGPSSAILVQLEVSMEATLCALKAGVAKGATTFFTPAPAPPGGLKDADFFTHTSVLIPNEGEARALLGAPSTTPLPDVARDLLGRGVGAVVVTLGPRGALVVTADGGCVEVPSPKVSSVVDTTGAGDCFSGSLAFFYTLLVSGGGSAGGVVQSSKARAVDGEALLEATRRAVYVAALSVTRKGTQSSYTRRVDLPPVLFSLDSSSSVGLPTLI